MSTDPRHPANPVTTPGTTQRAWVERRNIRRPLKGEADNEMLRAAMREMPDVAGNAIEDGHRGSQMMVIKTTT